MTLLKSDLINIFQKGSKSLDKRGIGIEKECFLYDKSTGRRLGYDQIRLVLEGFSEHGYESVFENENIIGCKHNGSSLSLEPGGQFELSAKIHNTLHEAKQEVDVFDSQLKDILDQHNFFNRDIGFEPIFKRDDLPWMPKGRYKIMREYMPKKGNHGLDMMRRTCTLQTNLDYTSEKNMAEMMFLTNALTPIVAGLFAASPFYEGKPSGYKSFREFVWQDTDHDRCGLLPFAFNKTEGQPSMTFDDYLDYALNIPMYFVYRDGHYIDVSGELFKDFIKGQLPSYPNEYATLNDFYDQLTLPFPEVRLKTFVEIRCVDASPIAFASSAFFVGLLYCPITLQKALNFIQNWTFNNIQEQYVRIPRDGLLENEWNLATHLYALAEEGLKNRCLGEEIYLSPLQAILDKRETYSDVLISEGF